MKSSTITPSIAQAEQFENIRQELYLRSNSSILKTEECNALKKILIIPTG